MRKRLLLILSTVLTCTLLALAQSNAPGTNGIQTYINPIQPGEHPDQTMIRVGNDYYSTGSTFHFAPYVPILHSTDMVHWETIARVVPANTSAPVNDATSAGIWQGALAYFSNKYWVYYSINSSQWFSNATDPKGPWSAPTRMTGSTVTGYDNSVFVDDDGTPYLLMKNGQSVNRIQQIDKTTGQITGTLMNMDWINANNRYSWAEGPVMCKRNGRYYYFMAGNVTGGQYAMSSATLTATESAWTLHGNFFSTASSPGGFTGPNHMTQPVQAPDGTWWTMSHCYDNSGWYGQGRLGLLHQVTFDANGVPHGVPPSTNPVLGPNLPSSNISYNFPKSDYFLTSTLKLDWHFFNKANATKYSLTASPGNIRLSPGTGTTHILQKEGGHYYSLVTKVNLNATANGNQAGLRIMNGKDDLFATLYTGYNGGKKIGFAYNGTSTEVNNSIGNVIWLKIERELHNIKGYYSADGFAWTQVGGTIDVSNLDKYSTNYNEWVGTSIGLYATNITADFDLFMYRDGFAPIKVIGKNNHFGVTNATKTPGTVVTNSTSGDWLMLAGVNMGQDGLISTGIDVNAASTGTGSLEVWIDNIGGTGTKIATVSISSSGGTDTWKTYSAALNASGQHDVYLRWVGGANAFFVNTIKFTTGAAGTPPTVNLTAPVNNSTYTTLETVTLTANAADADGTVSKVEFYDGATLISSDNTSPYSASWSGMSAGTHTLTAVATDNIGLSTTSTAVTLTIQGVQAPYKGTAFPIPGTIQFEEYDLGGNGVAYLDNTPGSEVTPVVNYRTTEDVDIETCTDAGTGYNIGYATAGEWLEYTVNVQAAGSYDMDLRIACNGDGRTVSLSMDGTTFANNVTIPNTAGWQTWQTVSVKNISFTAGQKVMRLTIGATDYVNLNYVTFTPSTITGLEETEASQMVLYPNPFNDQFHIEIPNAFSFQLLNMEGKVIEEGKSEGKVDVGRNCPKGMYMLKITQGNQNKMLKVVKD